MRKHFKPPVKETRHERLRRGRLACAKICDIYPAVCQIRFQLEFQDESARSALADQLHELNGPSRAFFCFPCPHGDCNGLFDLESAVSSLISQAENEVSHQIRCEGLRGAKLQSPCAVHLGYTIS